MSCRSVAPFSAASVAPAFRRPWAEQCGRPASRQRSLNQFPKPFDVNGLPRSVMRKVRFWLGHASIAARRAGSIGTSSVIGLVLRPLCWV
ncbi:hypothetical protein ASG52_18930 [Methylobacterium sp. Leaf456]|nr:hypothetical protein ASG52_18930 [Methylobacterium sp. Leaf456]